MAEAGEIGFYKHDSLCSVLVLSGWGGDYMPGYRSKEPAHGTIAFDINMYANEEARLEAFKKAVRKKMLDYDTRKAAMSTRVLGDTCMTHELAAIESWTSSLQIDGEAILKALGFQQSGPFSSSKYNGLSKMSHWVMDINEFIDAVGYERYED